MIGIDCHSREVGHELFRICMGLTRNYTFWLAFLSLAAFFGALFQIKPAN